LTKVFTALAAVLVCFNFAYAQTRGRAAAREKGELVRLIRQDKEVAEFLADDPGEANELAGRTTVNRIDLNGDGRPEYDVVLEGGYICGALGNCPHWIYRKAGGGYELLLRTRAREVAPEKTSTGGYRDLRSSAGDTATHDYFDISKYDGSRYKTTDCFTRDNSRRRSKVTRIPCADAQTQ
jgi:hypothetical protein